MKRIWAWLFRGRQRRARQTRVEAAERNVRRAHAELTRLIDQDRATVRGTFGRLVEVRKDDSARN